MSDPWDGPGGQVTRGTARVPAQRTDESGAPRPSGGRSAARQAAREAGRPRAAHDGRAGAGRSGAAGARCGSPE
ncbi:hypothetical protein H4K36_03900 [Streptomyces sp. DHE7-1]|nr:hypothetical protein [Streptomyces sp. DHE7-1]